MASYATPTNLTDRYDFSLIGELCDQAGVPLTLANVLASTKVAAALADASGLIDAALTQAGRYTPTQLAGLASTDNTYYLLVRITCDLAMGLLRRRRGYDESQGTAMNPFKDAVALLERLQNGEDVFGFDPVKAAGVANIIRVSRVSRIVQDSARYFGNRADLSGIHVNPE